MLDKIQSVFLLPITSRQQIFLTLFTAFLFILMPQWPPIDWDLNNLEFWSRFPNMYANPNVVYPPWALILMLPYYLMQAWGTRVCSVLVIAWLVYQEKWPLSKFFAIILSPYFLVTMSKSNMDILVFVFPLLLWRAVARTSLQNIGWGLAIAFSLLKPQGAILIWPYLYFTYSGKIKAMIMPLALVAILLIPISFIGHPPLLFQWLDNIAHPSAQNDFFWATNNVSMTAKFTLLGTMVILALIACAIYLLVKYKKIIWSQNHSIFALLLSSMLLSPYTSQQSLSAAFSFIFSAPVYILQVALFVLRISNISRTLGYEYFSIPVLLAGLISLLLFKPVSSR